MQLNNYHLVWFGLLAVTFVNTLVIINADLINKVNFFPFRGFCPIQNEHQLQSCPKHTVNTLFTRKVLLEKRDSFENLPLSLQIIDVHYVSPRFTFERDR